MSASRPNEHLTMGSLLQSAQNQSGSPTSTSPAGLSPFGLGPAPSSTGRMGGASRSGAGSPSHDMATPGRPFTTKRAREIQAQEGVSGMPLNPWGGPPTSGNSPLRENIPESPTDGFPDFAQLPALDSLPQTRRGRAGTLPSRFSPGGAGNGLLGLPTVAPKTSRPSPIQTPFQSPSPAQHDPRSRAGSLPQRSGFGPTPVTNSPFGNGIFNTTWNTASGRERGNTLASIASVGSNGPSSPAQSHFSRDGTAESDVHIKTLDYLGLVETTPQPSRAQLATPYMPPNEARFRSYSVNHKDAYHDDDEEEFIPDAFAQSQLAGMSHLAGNQLYQQMSMTNAAIRDYNRAVLQATYEITEMTRPRARTAGVLDRPPIGTFLPTPSRLDKSMTAAEARSGDQDFDDLSQSVAGLSLSGSNNRNNLGVDDQGSEGPTSALWLGGIPTSTTTSTLNEWFKRFGPIKSVRVLTHKNCGFVNFEREDSAIAARNMHNGKEIFPGCGAIRINFAKPPSGVNTPGHEGAFPSPSPDPFAQGQENGHARTTASSGVVALAAGPSNGDIRPLRDMAEEIMGIVGEFGSSDPAADGTTKNLDNAIQFTDFIDDIPPIKEATHTRIHDAPKLREIRKRIDNQSYPLHELEKIAEDMLPEIAELSSDYLGNTVVQKLFEHCSVPIRDQMLAEIAPHLAEIGCHKNGTWAAQKIINVCNTPQQKETIVRHIRSYAVPLFLDQFGNYVLQACLHFGAPYTDFLFETMLSRMWDIAQGRFGSRAMRACLESHHATKTQQRLLAAGIALHTVRLATNTNGALLITWLLDTCTLPRRRSVLAPQIIPHLVQLCTHKVAYMTVLKVINQKAEPEARDRILQALFFGQHNQVLEAILKDHNCGATFIFKVLTTPFFDENIRSQVVENVKNVLIHIKAQPGQGYKRLMDEVGLSTRGGSSGPSGNGASRDHSSNGGERQRPNSRQTNPNAPTTQHYQSPHPQQQPGQYNTGGQFYPLDNHINNPLNASANQARYDMNYVPRGEGAEPNQAQPFPAFGSPGVMFGGGTNPMNPVSYQQLSFPTNMPQHMMARGAPPMNFYPMPAVFGGFPGASAFPEQYRNNSRNGSPTPSTQAPYAPPGFGMIPGYPYPGMAPNVGYTPEQPNNNTRRGRPGRSPQSEGRRRQ